jgi:rod shape-determining protein MreC
MLNDVSRYSNVVPGDTIVTSGSSSYFPEGVMVGTVEEAYPSVDGLYMTLKVQLCTSFSQLEDVFVVRKMDAEELEELKQLLKPKKGKKK